MADLNVIHSVNPAPVLDEQAIRRAVEIHARSYNLLRWLESAIDRGFIAFDAAHHYTTFPEAARAWLDEHYLNVPENARPRREDLAEFSAFFGTYLESSFHLVEAPGQRRYSPNAHCFCPLCSWLVDIPRLQPKKLTRSDKKRAREPQRDYLERAALETDVELSDSAVDAMLDAPELRGPLPLAAYGEDLLRRMRGQSHGAATLALWRQLAWLPAGSPRKDFQLCAEDILQADRLLHARVKSTGA